MNISECFSNLALVRFCTDWICIKQGPGVFAITTTMEIQNSKNCNLAIILYLSGAWWKTMNTTISLSSSLNKEKRSKGTTVDYTDRNFVAFSSQQVLHFELEVTY